MPAPVGLKVHDLITQLAADGHVPVEEMPWLKDACRNSKPFWEGLVAYSSQLLPSPLKSVPLESYDFYNDIVKRHAPDRAAFRWFDPDEDRFESFTIGELDMLCGRRAKEWEGRGVASGQVVAIMMPMGPDFVIALLTALKIGATVSVIPLTGQVAIRKQLASVAPDHIAVDPIYLRYLGDLKDKAIPLDLPPATETYETSGVYSANSPWAKLCSPFSPKPFEAVPVVCDSGYLWALRDGLITYGLKTGDTLVAPALPIIPFQPSLIVATLLAGAVYCHVDLEHLKKKPELLDSPFKHVVVTREVRDLILASKKKVGRAWKSWSRFLHEGGDSLRWGTFVTQAGLEPSQSGNIFLDSAMGGCLNISMKRKLPKGGWNNYALPAPGAEWWLTAMNGKDMKTALPIGRFTYKKPGEDEPPPGHNVVKKEEGELLFIGPQTPHREGRTYPSDALLEIVDEFPFALEASVVAEQTGDVETPYQFALAVFCGHELKKELKQRGAEWRDLLEEAITRDLGPDALPDVIDFFPLYARRKDKCVDHAWVQASYGMGVLHERSRTEPYTLLTELRSLVFKWEAPLLAPLPPPPEGGEPPPEEPPPEEPPPETPPETPPEETPPSDAPPSDAPPSDTPPETPPEGSTDAPPSDAPPSDAPPSDAPPSDAPPSDAPPSDAPPSDTPPSDAPPSDTPPSDTPAEASSDAPPADAPPAEVDAAPSSEGDVVSETPTETQEGQEPGTDPAPNVTSDVMIIVDDMPSPSPDVEPPSETPPEGESQDGSKPPAE